MKTEITRPQITEVAMALTASLALLAERLELDYIAAIALPAAIRRAADKAGISDAEVIRACWDVAEIGECIASVCNDQKVRYEIGLMLAENAAAQQQGGFGPH